MHSFDRTESRLTDIARTRVSDGDTTVHLGQLNPEICLGRRAPELSGRCVLVATSTQVLSAAALVMLDGVVRRLAIAPPDLKPDDLPAFIEDADLDTVVTDQPDAFRHPTRDIVSLRLVPAKQGEIPLRCHDSEWILATSGTSGRPKLVAHSLAALTGAFSRETPAQKPQVWATFYDIRRYGGLQIFLRALFGNSDLILSRPGECIEDHLQRLGDAGVTSISGTPSHWRRVLMSGARDAINPAYVRLSGEIADQMVLDSLRAAYPQAAIGHAYASTEAGVAFAINDGLEGFPATLLDGGKDVALKVVSGTLRIRSTRTASRYVGTNSKALQDDDGFVDTEDLVEQRGLRYFFVGRRGGIINVGGLKVNPEEVEAAINSHRNVRMSLVGARKNSLVGAIVVAEIVLRDSEVDADAMKADILSLCRARLPAHKVPALVRFVPSLPLTPAGKLSRDPAAMADVT